MNKGENSACAIADISGFLSIENWSSKCHITQTGRHTASHIYTPDTGNIYSIAQLCEFFSSCFFSRLFFSLPYLIHTLYLALTHLRMIIIFPRDMPQKTDQWVWWRSSKKNDENKIRSADLYICFIAKVISILANNSIFIHQHPIGIFLFD